MFVSYAQNFEDVILWRALKHVKNGTYIDVGAQDPIIDSVSLAFYEKGWRGIHVEPNAQYANMLREARPDEQVIETVIARDVGEIPFFEIENTGLSTGDEDIARIHSAGGLPTKRVMKPSKPLSEILDLYKNQDVHWLKVDVEGMERAVIESWKPSRVRPWVVVVEATKPRSPVQNSKEWESILENIGYEFTYFDGLNKFYLSKKHQELKKFFGPGPNFFDDFILSSSVTAPFYKKIKAEESTVIAALEAEICDIKTALNTSLAEMQQIRASLAEMQQIRADLEMRLAKEQKEKAALQEQADKIYASTSWRITAPLRWLKSAISTSGIPNHIFHGVYAWVTLKPGSRPRRLARSLVTKLRTLFRRTALLGLRFLRAHPIAYAAAKRILKFIPTPVRNRLLSFTRAPAPTLKTGTNSLIHGTEVQTIYSRLHGLAKSSPNYIFTDNR